MRRVASAVLLCVLLLADGRARAGEAPASLPRFSRHVVSVFSRLGCNDGTCHGAVQGKNGFRLSLFGAFPDRDHAAIVRDHGGRRIDLQDPARSLLLKKATGAVPHGGGSRTKP